MASQSIYWFKRRAVWRISTAIFFSFLVLAPAVAEAKVPRAYAGIVVDAKSGKVLYESDADATRYPASVTKVMTLYILFQELAAGKIKLGDTMPVSKWAASASPTKLGLRAGSSITVDNAIKSIVTISANDMARVIAEYIGGSESGFAKRMTLTAKALGMRHTLYVNASGLPDGRQVTTVRDQAVLGAAVYEHFPQYYGYFQTASFKYGKRTYRGHDNLLGHNGVDGLKTGYTGAAGYNLLTAARKDGRHIVVVGFGFASGGKRDAKVRDLVDTYLPKARSGNYLDVAMIPMPGRKGSPVPAPADDGVRVASADVAIPLPLPAPAFRMVDGEDAPANPQSGIGDVDTDLAVASIAPAPLERPIDLGMPPAIQAVDKATGTTTGKRKRLDQVVGAFTDNYSLGAAPAPLGATRASAPLIPPVGIGDKGQPVDLMTSGSISTEASISPVTDAWPQSLGIEKVAEVRPEQAMPSKLPQGWIVQIGASPTEDGANGLISSAADKVRSLSNLQNFVERFEKDGQTYFRARFGGFSGQSAANDMCKQLKQAKLSCLAMQS
ncbi:MAG: D-alanyl-D-alanine carboxypeptidase [Devosia sp.]